MFQALSITMLITPIIAAAGKVEFVAHRGASYDAPENTLAALKLAWEQKADASEFDIYLSKDGKIVVIHDADTKRTAGVERKVSSSTLDELRALDVGTWKDKRFAGEKIPTLEEMLAAVPEGKKVFVEVKCGPEVVPELNRVLKCSGLKPERTPIISFSANVVAAVKKARPEIPAYWIVSLNRKGQQSPTADELIAKAKEIRADGLDLSAAAALDKPYAEKIKAAGLRLYVYTVNDMPTAKRMIAIGVDGITTDRPGWLREKLTD